MIHMLPARKHYTTEQRNALVLRMEGDIHRLLNRHRTALRFVGSDPKDTYQELVLCAIDAIDRSVPAEEAAVRHSVMDVLTEKLETITRQTEHAALPFGVMTRYGYEISLGAVA